MKKEFKKGGVLTRKGYRKNKKKEEIKKTIKILFIGFILGILYSYLFIYQDLIKSTQRAETVALVQLDQKEENIKIIHILYCMKLKVINTLYYLKKKLKFLKQKMK